MMNAGLVNEPLEFLLFSEFAVVLAMVHLYTLFMVTPIFNTLMRIDRSLVEAARDAGASGWQILVNVILPLAKPGIAIGSIFVITLVMGDFITVRFMSGGQSASVGLIMANQMSLLQYPAAAANSLRTAAMRSPSSRCRTCSSPRRPTDARITVCARAARAACAVQSHFADENVAALTSRPSTAGTRKPLPGSSATAPGGSTRVTIAIDA